MSLAATAELPRLLFKAWAALGTVAFRNQTSRQDRWFCTFCMLLMLPGLPTSYRIHEAWTHIRQPLAKGVPVKTVILHHGKHEFQAHIHAPHLSTNQEFPRRSMAAAAPPNVQFGIEQVNSFDDSNSDDQSWKRALFEAHRALIPIGWHTCKAEFLGQRLCACTPSDFRFWIKSVRTPLPWDCHGFLYSVSREAHTLVSASAGASLGCVHFMLSCLVHFVLELAISGRSVLIIKIGCSRQQFPKSTFNTSEQLQ